jgi:hypothetical protein
MDLKYNKKQTPTIKILPVCTDFLALDEGSLVDQ